MLGLLKFYFSKFITYIQSHINLRYKNLYQITYYYNLKSVTELRKRTSSVTFQFMPNKIRQEKALHSFKIPLHRSPNSVQFSCNICRDSSLFLPPYHFTFPLFPRIYICSFFKVSVSKYDSTQNWKVKQKFPSSTLRCYLNSPDLVIVKHEGT